MPKDSKPKKTKKSLMEQIREAIAKSSPGGYLISKSKEQVDKALKRLK